ncbi:hypothetical protein K0M31_014774 [Melipona bicolor]|uniref:Uncharacterized protein n=1 Tax=Melipona bicolor TaxID=60889 RepID=A0AA40FGU3_9HYME|nr:hypothetical protein K0M31_014774 [Melipona bicolor]
MDEDAEFQVDRVVPRSVEAHRLAELAATTRELAPAARISFAEATRYSVSLGLFIRTRKLVDKPGNRRVPGIDPGPSQCRRQVPVTGGANQLPSLGMTVSW